MRIPSILVTAVIALNIIAAINSYSQTTFIPLGTDWKYLDNGSDQGTGWAQPAFDDSGWASGPAQLGYGDGDESTVVSFGPDGSDKYTTTYFRHSFTVADASAAGTLQLDMVRDDGAIVYLNGAEVFRTNMPGGAVNHLTHASSAIDDTSFQSMVVDPALLTDGANVIAVEIHQANATSSDISFDLRLEESTPLRRGPYLQKGSASSMTVRWRTDVAGDSVVRYGIDAQNLNLTASSPTATTGHEITISSLTPDTRYFYSIGDSGQTLASGADYFFVTHPVSGTASPTRIWVLGDSGTANANAAAVRDAYLAANGGSHADLVLMLGDNAYNSGTDSEYQAAVFDMYPTVLRNSVLWSTLGNHDGASADSATQSGPYYDIFSFPVSGESGGISSGTEAYYSFDYANIHFVCLDSYETDRSTGGAMAAWARNDLAMTTQEWIIAFWHHPPYSKGSHNSDTETQLIQMREVFNPIFEDYGVDLVLGGHSHSYERSMLIDGHYESSDTFSAANTVDGGDGDPDGAGGYFKQPAPNAGAVYAVPGSSGKISGGALDHPAMIRNLNQLGSMIIDINGNQLDALFLNASTVVTDQFRITHQQPTGNPPAAPSDLAANTSITSPTSELDLTWTDNAINEDGFRLQRSIDQVAWSQIATLAADTVSFSDTGLGGATEYFYRVFAYNADGNSPNSNIGSATTDPEPTASYVAFGEIPSLGTVGESYIATTADGGAVESITEVESGGKPGKRRSQLQHSWQINVAAGAVTTLIANTWSSGSSDSDTFLFEYSIDSGGSWSTAFDISNTSTGNLESVILPSGVSGEIRVRVTDTNRTQGNRGLDTVFIDDLFILVENGTGDPPAAPTGLGITGVAAGQIDLAWTDASTDELGFEIERFASGDADWTVIATAAADTIAFADTAVAPNTLYQYRVRAFNGSGSSAWSNTASETTPDGIALATSGYKVKGRITVDLTWSNATSANVNIHRNGAFLATVPAADGAYTDETRQKGGGTFTYKVCEKGNPAACSNESTVVF